jgi:hypothetical protein
MGLDHSLMLTESVILVETLGELQSRGIVALGLQDGLMVVHSRGHEEHGRLPALIPSAKLATASTCRAVVSKTGNPGRSS